MRRLAAVLAGTALVAAAVPAGARANDPALWKLGSPRPLLGDGTTNPLYSEDAQARFEAFAIGLGLAVSSFSGAPAKTPGAFGVELAYVHGSAGVAGERKLGDRYVWPVEDDGPATSLSMPGFLLRKGLPWSFELGMRVQGISETSMTALTVELGAALVEGVPSAPDVSIRAHGTRLLGARDLSLATAGVDVRFSRDFGVAGTFRIAPYGGWDPTVVFASSNAVDFDPFAEVSENPALDDAVFDAFTSLHHRLYGGVRLAAGPGTLSFEVSRAFAGADSVTGYGLALGAAF